MYVRAALCWAVILTAISFLAASDDSETQKELEVGCSRVRALPVAV